MNLPDINKVLFMDIETVPQYKTFSEAPEILQHLFVQKFKNKTSEVQNAITTDEIWEEMWNLKAPLSAEFGKIVCISIGMIHNGKFATKSFASENELELLTKFVSGKTLEKFNDTSGKNSYICVYNGEIFDLPFVAKRLIINGLNVPKTLFFPDLKPWERNFIIDIKNIWKWDVYDGAISLGLLGCALGLEIHKDEMDGSMVKDVYYIEKNIKKISDYCEKDITLLYKVYEKLSLINATHHV
jgi:predicted PolB exonuclease-like 3'-5' exonuclease